MVYPEPPITPRVVLAHRRTGQPSPPGGAFPPVSSTRGSHLTSAPVVRPPTLRTVSLIVTEVPFRPGLLKTLVFFCPGLLLPIPRSLRPQGPFPSDKGAPTRTPLSLRRGASRRRGLRSVATVVPQGALTPPDAETESMGVPMGRETSSNTIFRWASFRDWVFTVDVLRQGSIINSLPCVCIGQHVCHTKSFSLSNL